LFLFVAVASANIMKFAIVAAVMPALCAATAIRASASDGSVDASVGGSSNVAIVTGKTNCASIAVDPVMSFFNWASMMPSQESANAEALAWCNTGGLDPTEHDPVPEANCSVAQSWCDDSSCNAIALYWPDRTTYAGRVVAISAEPAPMTVAMVDALSACTEAVCTGTEVDCSNGIPLCIIDSVVCGPDALYMTEKNVENFKYFNGKPLPKDTYVRLSTGENVIGTVATLHY
jgi:hypothetical protein